MREGGGQTERDSHGDLSLSLSLGSNAAVLLLLDALERLLSAFLRRVRFLLRSDVTAHTHTHRALQLIYGRNTPPFILTARSFFLDENPNGHVPPGRSEPKPETRKIKYHTNNT